MCVCRVSVHMLLHMCFSYRHCQAQYLLSKSASTCELSRHKHATMVLVVLKPLHYLSLLSCPLAVTGNSACTSGTLVAAVKSSCLW